MVVRAASSHQQRIKFMTEELKNKLHKSSLIYFVLYLIIYISNISFTKYPDLVLDILAAIAVVFVVNRLVKGKSYHG